jgi:hypothetical protein
MNRLRAIAIEEQRQLMTFGFAVLVFLMTLIALQLHNQDSTFNPQGSPLNREGSTLNRVSGANRGGVGHALHQDRAASPGNHAVALAATSLVMPLPSIDLR